jgi:hypothetical protein
MTATRVSATPAALELIRRLEARHGPLLFHQSGGCCDGSSPMCFPRAEFAIGEVDVLLGEIGGQPFYMSDSQFAYWMHTHLIIEPSSRRSRTDQPHRRISAAPKSA